jgi:hypothetical protein
LAFGILAKIKFENKFIRHRRCWFNQVVHNFLVVDCIVFSASPRFRG